MIAGAIVSICIGSGFATGQELLQFFTAHGYKGLFTGLICMITMCYCCSTLLMLGKSGKIKDSNEIFVYLFGKYIGSIFKIIIPLFCLCSFVVMISGAGATLTQYYGVNKNIGQVLLALLSLISVMMGMDKVLKILGKIGPIIIVVVITVSIITILKNFYNLDKVPQVLNQITINKAVKSWWMSGIIYSGLNIIFATQFLVGAGPSLKHSSSCKWGGIIAVVCTILGIVGGSLPFAKLVNIMYPISGVFGIFIIIGLVCRKFRCTIII